jgi:hypothetical protein
LRALELKFSICTQQHLFRKSSADGTYQEIEDNRNVVLAAML